MEILEPLIVYLRKHSDITDEEFRQQILPFLTIRKFGKKEIVLQAGEVEDYFNFILKGMVRKYYRKNTHEINTQISPEGHIIHSQESFHSRTPSEYYIETIEPTTFVSVTYDNLEKMYSQNQKMERLGRRVITATMVLKDRWQMQMIQLTPRERFLNFVHKNPDLVQRVPQKYLASYLNIKPETFSRFKHLIRTSSK